MPGYFHPGRKVFFQHVACTGGAEFYSVIQAVYGDVAATAYRGDREANCAQALAAVAMDAKTHFVLTHADPIGPLPAHVAAITLYRNPVERALSQHFFAQREARATGKPEPEFPPRAAWPDHGIVGANYYLKWACRLAGLPLDGREIVDSRALTLANAVVDRGFAWIGITERFSDSLRLLAEVVNWPTLPASTPQEHVKSGRPKTADLDPEIVAWANHVTLFDQMLYARAMERFEREINAIGQNNGVV